MTTVMIYVLFVIGIILIIKGGDYFVDAASWIAEISGVPKFIIGATVVSIATTLPELFVSAIASFNGKTDMAVGNAVGSVTVNLGLILGISIICMPVTVSRKNIMGKSLLMLGSALALAVLSYSGELRVYPSLILLLLFAVFVFENISQAKKSLDSYQGTENKSKKEAVVNIIKFIAGAAGIIIGADLLVDNGSAIARMLGVSESIIGVTIVAIGTSLPELVTTVTAIAKKQSSLSIGNILGANIIDLTLILPICAVISGGSLPVSAQSTMFDIPVCLLISAIALIPALVTKKFNRFNGILLISLYAVYLTTVCI